MRRGPPGSRGRLEALSQIVPKPRDLVDAARQVSLRVHSYFLFKNTDHGRTLSAGFASPLKWRVPARGRHGAGALRRGAHELASDGGCFPGRAPDRAWEDWGGVILRQEVKVTDRVQPRERHSLVQMTFLAQELRCIYFLSRIGRLSGKNHYTRLCGPGQWLTGASAETSRERYCSVMLIHRSSKYSANSYGISGTALSARNQCENKRR